MEDNNNNLIINDIIYNNMENNNTTNDIQLDTTIDNNHTTTNNNMEMNDENNMDDVGIMNNNDVQNNEIVAINNETVIDNNNTDDIDNTATTATNINTGLVKRYFTIVAPDDVLLGRGARFTNNEGNKRFRTLINERKDEYLSSNRHQLKNNIATEIIDEIRRNRKGLFLRMVDTNLNILKQNGLIPNDASSAWYVADDNAILQKVKQALREVDELTTEPEQSYTTYINNKSSSSLLTSTKTKRKWIARNSLPPKIMTVEVNDVLLGRGAAIIHNEGNIKFRKLVIERKEEYILSKRHQLKNTIAKEIINEITHNRKGRFLRMIEGNNLEELIQEKEHIPIDEKSAWVVADDIVILEKVKQALRELDDTPVAMNKKRRWNCKLSLARAAEKEAKTLKRTNQNRNKSTKTNILKQEQQHQVQQV